MSCKTNYDYLKLPRENSHMGVLLEYICRDIWLTRRELFEMLNQIYRFHCFNSFSVVHNTLYQRGFLEWRRTPLGHLSPYNNNNKVPYSRVRQWRLSEEAAKLNICKPRGRKLASRPRKERYGYEKHSSSHGHVI